MNKTLIATSIAFLLGVGAASAFFLLQQESPVQQVSKSAQVQTWLLRYQMSGKSRKSWVVPANANVKIEDAVDVRFLP